MSLSTLQPAAAAPRFGGTSRAASLASNLSAEAVIFTVFWLLLLVAGRGALFQDPGVFWHTVVGEQMLARGELAHADTLSFTYQGQPWIAHQWLGECLMASIYRLAGWDGLLIATATLLAALFAWIGSRWRAGGLNGFATTAVLAVLFLACAHHFHVRPHLASMIGMAAAMALLSDVEAGRRRTVGLFWLIPLVAVWTNLHGGALGGLATVTLVFCGWVLYAALGLASPLRRRGDGMVLASVWIGCLAVMMLNPYGWRMFETWIAIMRMSLPGMIVEHGRPDPRHIETWMLVVIGASFLVLMGSLMPRHDWRRPWRIFQGANVPQATWLVTLVWLLLASDRVRHVPLAALAVAIVLPDLLQASRWRNRFIERGWLRADGQRRASEPTPLARLWPVAIGVVLLAVAACGSGSAWGGPRATRWPVELADDLHAIATEGGRDHRIFNALDFGGFVAFHAPELRIFIDDRCELYGEAFLREYFRAETGQPEQIEAWRSQYQFRHALVRTGSPFDDYLARHADWRVIARSPVGTLYRHHAMVRLGSPDLPSCYGH